mgnify:CR=1 FL=1
MSIPFRLWIRGGCTLFCLSPAACRRDTLRRPQCRSLAQDAAVFLLLVQAPIRRELTFHAGENLCLRRLVRRRQCQVRYTNQMQCHPLVKAQGKRHRCLDSQTATFRGQLGLLPMCVCADVCRRSARAARTRGARVCDANLLREWCAVRRPRYGSGDTAAATRSSAQHVHVLVCVCACERVSCVLCVIRNVAGHEVERGAEFAQHRVETMAAWFGGIVWRWFIVRVLVVAYLLHVFRSTTIVAFDTTDTGVTRATCVCVLQDCRV